MKAIYIQTMPSEKVALLLDGNEVKQITFDRFREKSIVGNIFLGRVARIDHGRQAAFIDIGMKKLAFLPKKELPLLISERKKRIENVIHEGMNLIVQVIKDPINEKGAVVTGNVTFPGQYLIYMPYSGYVAFFQEDDYRNKGKNPNNTK